MLNNGLFTSARGDWKTPKNLMESLNQEFQFTVDVTPPNHNEDWLQKEWTGAVYANPPYGRGLIDWCKKAYESKAVVVMLLPARTDTKWFHEYCMKAFEIRFIKGRLKFDDQKNSAPFPSMIVIWRYLKI